MNASGMTAWSPAAFGLSTCPRGISGSAWSARPELFVDEPLAYLKLRAAASWQSFRHSVTEIGPTVVQAVGCQFICYNKVKALPCGRR